MSLTLGNVEAFLMLLGDLGRSAWSGDAGWECGWLAEVEEEDDWPWRGWWRGTAGSGVTAWTGRGRRVASFLRELLRLSHIICTSSILFSTCEIYFVLCLVTSSWVQILLLTAFQYQFTCIISHTQHPLWSPNYMYTMPSFLSSRSLTTGQSYLLYQSLCLWGDDVFKQSLKFTWGPQSAVVWGGEEFIQFPESFDSKLWGLAALDLLWRQKFHSLRTPLVSLGKQLNVTKSNCKVDCTSIASSASSIHTLLISPIF